MPRPSLKVSFWGKISKSWVVNLLSLSPSKNSTHLWQQGLILHTGTCTYTKGASRNFGASLVNLWRLFNKNLRVQCSIRHVTIHLINLMFDIKDPSFGMMPLMYMYIIGTHTSAAHTKKEHTMTTIVLTDLCTVQQVSSR